MASLAKVALEQGGLVSGEVVRECLGVTPVEGGLYLRKKYFTSSIARRLIV